MQISLSPLSVLLLSLAIGSAAGAGDWPQILGPKRSGIASSDEKLAAKWPEGGPRQQWEIPVGRGFAGPAVLGNQVIVLDRDGNTERVRSVSIEDGATGWTQFYPTDFVPQYGQVDGPMSVPGIADGAVVTFGAQGVLSCLELATGDVRWRHDTQTEFDALEGYFGAGSSPLVDNGTVYVIVGGRSQKAGIVAFDLSAGTVKWQAVADGASYSSPMIATVDGRQRLIALTRFKCVVLNPADGAVELEFPYGVRSPSVTAANPLVLRNQLFLSASYGIGARLVGFDGSLSWESNDIMSSQYTTCIEHEGLLYGIDGRQDGPAADLRCFDPLTQKIAWTESGIGYASLLKADGKLLITKTNGELVLAKLNSERFEPLATARPFKNADERRNPLRAFPALSNGRLYIRDGQSLKCLDLK